MDQQDAVLSVVRPIRDPLVESVLQSMEDFYAAHRTEELRARISSTVRAGWMHCSIVHYARLLIRGGDGIRVAREKSFDYVHLDGPGDYSVGLTIKKLRRHTLRSRNIETRQQVLLREGGVFPFALKMIYATFGYTEKGDNINPAIRAAWVTQENRTRVIWREQLYSADPSEQLVTAQPPLIAPQPLVVVRARDIKKETTTAKRGG